MKESERGKEDNKSRRFFYLGLSHISPLEGIIDLDIDLSDRTYRYYLGGKKIEGKQLTCQVSQV